MLLREMAGDRSRPLFELIAEGTLIWWTDDDETWAKFQQVAHRIADQVTTACLMAYYYGFQLPFSADQRILGLLGSDVCTNRGS